MIFNYNGIDYELIMLTVTGSRMYGNSTPSSDWDYRGVFIESIENKIGIKTPIEQLGGLTKKGTTFELDNKGNKIYNSQGQELYEILKDLGLNINLTDDIELYELNRFTKLALENNPNILDLLCHNTNNSIYLNDKGKALLENKDLFLSKKLRDSFAGYALSQLKKIKSHNKWIDKFPDTGAVLSFITFMYNQNKIDFNWICDNFGGEVAIKTTNENPQQNRSLNECITWEDFVEEIASMSNNNRFIEKYRLPQLIDYCYPKDLKGKTLDLNERIYTVPEHYQKEDNGIPIYYSLKKYLENFASFRTMSPSSISIFSGGQGLFSKEGNLKCNDPKKIGDFICLLSIDHMKYKSDKDIINKMWDWKCNRNEKRSVMEDEYGYDLKHASHLVRLLMACEEILRTNKYIPELSNERLQLVKDVRAGKYDYDWLIDFSEKYNYKLDILNEKSTLQDSPNYDIVNTLIVDIQTLEIHLNNYELESNFESN